MRPVGLPLRESVSSLCRGHANLLCIVPIFSYVTPKGTLAKAVRRTYQRRFYILFNSRGVGRQKCERRRILNLSFTRTLLLLECHSRPSYA